MPRFRRFSCAMAYGRSPLSSVRSRSGFVLDPGSRGRRHVRRAGPIFPRAQRTACVRRVAVAVRCVVVRGLPSRYPHAQERHGRRPRSGTRGWVSRLCTHDARAWLEFRVRRRREIRVTSRAYRIGVSRGPIRGCAINGGRQHRFVRVGAQRRVGPVRVRLPRKRKMAC